MLSRPLKEIMTKPADQPSDDATTDQPTGQMARGVGHREVIILISHNGYFVLRRKDKDVYFELYYLIIYDQLSNQSLNSIKQILYK